VSNRKTVAVWDPSIIGITPEEMAEMSIDKQAERAADEIARAADILEHAIAAFGAHMRPTERRAIAEAANTAAAVARAIAEATQE